MKNELTTGDVVLATVADEIFTFEFYGWWDSNRQIAVLVVPQNGLTVLAAFDQVLLRVTKEKVLHVNKSSFKRKYPTREPYERAGDVVQLRGG
jgi:hypothetical protein